MESVTSIPPQNVSKQSKISNLFPKGHFLSHCGVSEIYFQILTWPRPYFISFIRLAELKRVLQASETLSSLLEISIRNKALAACR